MTPSHAHGVTHDASPRGEPSSTQWLGDSGASGNGTWTVGADWNGATVPGASASVTFATGNFGYTVLGDATIGAITVDGDGVTYDGTITQAGSSTGTFLTALDGANVTLDSNAAFSGNSIAFQDGTFLDVQGQLSVAGGSADAVAIDAAGAAADVSGVLSVNQLFVQNGGTYQGTLSLNNGGVLNFDTASTIDSAQISVQGGGGIFLGDAASVSGGAGTITGNITIESAAGPHAFLNLNASADTTLVVTGAIQNQSPVSGGGGSSVPANVFITSGTVELTNTGNDWGGVTVVQDANLILTGAANGGTGPIFVGDGSVSTGGSGYTGTVVTTGTSDTVYAGGAGLTVFGNQTGTLSFTGGSASSTVVGGAGVLVATGGSAGSAPAGTVTALATSAAVQTTPASPAGDLIFGGTSGNDSLYGGSGATTLVGGAGGHLIAQGSANQVLAAGSGTSFLDASASAGNDTLFGGNPANSLAYISGGSGLDTVVLNAGAAEVFSGSGTMDIFAGSGALTLEFNGGYPAGLENVVGFNSSTDTIAVIGYGSGAGAALLASAQIVDGSTVLHVQTGAELVLFGVTNLTAANFTTT